jgi:hypothetical protein
MAICGCGLPARCCQPAVAGGVIYADLRGELNTLMASQALFTQSSPVREPLLQAFPFPSTLREVTLHPLSLACVFIYNSHGKWVIPPLLCSFPPSATLTSFPAPASTGASLARPGLFIYSSRKDCLPLLSAQCTPPSFPRVFIVLIAYYSVSLFSPGWGSVCPGGYADLAPAWLWEYHVPLSSPCPCLPKPSRLGCLAAWGPSWFLHLT